MLCNRCFQEDKQEYANYMHETLIRRIEALERRIFERDAESKDNGDEDDPPNYRTGPLKYSPL